MLITTGILINAHKMDDNIPYSRGVYRGREMEGSQSSWGPQIRPSLSSQMDIRPLPVSTQLPSNMAPFKDFDKETSIGSQHLHFANLNDRHSKDSNDMLSPIQKISSIDKTHEILGVDNAIKGLRFLFHQCLTYPFIVFSRQCQAVPYYSIGSLFSAPVRSLSVMNIITHSQGVTSWWRGFKGHIVCLLGRPFASAALTWVAEKYSRNKRLSSTLNWLRYYSIRLIINGLSYAVCLPLTSFILIECVQHTTLRTYSSDYEGFRELTLERPSFAISLDPSNRLSFIQLLLPTAIGGLLTDMLTDQVLRLTTRFLSRTPTNNSNLTLRLFLRKLWASYISTFIVDFLMHPVKTVILRLHIQGIPILVENVETGAKAQFVTTYYTGPIDCTQGLWEAEGIAGFYKGFSSVVLQHVVYGLLLVALWRTIVYWEQWKSQK